MVPGTALSLIRLGLLLAGLFVGGLLASISPAMADLRVCNQTNDPVSVALGYRAQQGWQSEGWWVATPNQCAIVYQGPLNARYFYIYAADDVGGGAWDGTVYMCTRDETFTIFGVEDCLARGYERTGFFEVDTQNKSDWTLQLTNPNPAPPPEGGTDANSAGAPPPPDEETQPGDTTTDQNGITDTD
jgi:uncharacterized membrane protein